jgi:GT2 family glycosyltransferase
MIDIRGRHPRMSVAIPSYNHGRLIPEALAAISRQTMAPFEVAVVQSRRRHWQAPRRGQ